MPVLNPHPTFFPQAVHSILSQTHRELELLIIEDPSACSAADFLKDLGDNRIRHIQNAERTSLARQLNQGLNAARYDLIARMDADDVAHPGRLQKQGQFLRDHPDVSVLGSHMHIIDDAGKSIGFRRYPLDHDAILRTMTLYNAMAHPTIMYRRAAVLEVGGYQETNPEDYDLWSRLAQAGARFANYPEALIDYRVHPDTFKSTKLRDTIRGTLNVKKQYWMKQMGLRGRLRMLGERLLLFLPPKLVLKLFMRMYYERQ
jgi:glycosyltransferase involved in cell wall biosynthesis